VRAAPGAWKGTGGNVEGAHGPWNAQRACRPLLGGARDGNYGTALPLGKVPGPERRMTKRVRSPVTALVIPEVDRVGREFNC